MTVHPGITGLWQVSGRSDVSYEERVSLDMYYIRNWSIWLDLQILFQTIPVVLRRKGAY
jgi:lipopolysaccharide/colanic/teichoic acid biosynthesis glycosyltransferase